MNTSESILRSARLPELIFAVITLFVAVALPSDPDNNREFWRMLDWYGMTAVSFWLLFALRRPSRVAWIGAAALSAYFTVTCAIGIVRSPRGGAAAEYAGRAAALAYVMLGIALFAQLLVAARCWQSRIIWRRSAKGDTIAPLPNDR